MDDVHDSCSMTPPLSPVLGHEMEDNDPLHMESPPKRIHLEESEPDHPVCFECLGEVEPDNNLQTHPQGPLQTGHLDRLFSGKDPMMMMATVTVEMFGHQFVTQLDLDERMDTLFYMTQQHIDRVVCAATGLGATGSANEALQCRQEIRQFFSYMKSYVLWYANTGQTSDPFLKRLLSRVKSLLLHLGPLRQLPPHVLGACASRLGNQSLLASYHTFHLYLDIQWSIIETLHIISAKFPDWSSGLQLFESTGDDLNVMDMFTQCVSLLLWDVVHLAMVGHAKMSVSDYFRQGPFPCTCVKELCIWLLHLLNHRQKKMARQSFWVSLYPILQTVLSKAETGQHQAPQEPQDIDSDKFAMPPVFQCTDPVGFCWWLLVHLAPLYQYDQNGIPKAAKLTETGQNNYYAVLVLMKTMLGSQQTNVTEAQLRCHLRCCLRLSYLWGPNTEVVTTLWEYFYRKLNGHFRQPGAGLQGYASISKSAAGWLDQCKKICQPDAHKLENESSFQLFLRILATHLTSGSGGPRTNNTWKQLKGRFYTKFHARRMHELTEVGLSNFTSLFLVLAMVTDMEDVAGKMCDLYLTLGSLDTARRGTVWKGLFAVLLLHVEHGRDIDYLAGKLVEGFNNVCRELSSSGLEPCHYTELAQLFSLYLDSTQEIVEVSSSLALSEHKLIGSGIQEVLKTCRDSELRSLLSFTQSILAKHRLVTRRQRQPGHATSTVAAVQHRGVSDALWCHVFNFVKRHACTQTPPSQLADVGAGFTLLVMDSPPSVQTGMKEEFLQCFKYFGWDEHVNTRVSCRFLCHLLANESAVVRLSAVLTNHEACLVGAWFRCAWNIPPDDPQMAQLTRLMLKLEEVQSLYKETDIDPGDTPESVLNTFIMALGRKYSSLQDLRAKVAFQDRVRLLLGDVGKQVAPSKLAVQPELLQATYNLCGLLVKHCANFLYIKSRPDCVLPVLVERLVLPRLLLTPGKPPPPHLLTAIRKHLPQFLQGLSCLDYRRDPYIQRKLKDIVVQYLPRFSDRSTGASNVTSVHPLLTALSESCCRQPSDASIQFRQHILHILKTEFLILRGNTTHTTANLALAFFMDLFRKTLNSEIVARDSEVLLESLLAFNLLCENAGLRTLAMNAIQTMLEACTKVSQDTGIMDSVAHSLEQFVMCYLGVYQVRVLRVLEVVSVLYPPPLVQLIPVLTAAVRSTEAKRGVGVDKQLRVAYFSVLENLGEKGKTEKSALLVSSTGNKVPGYSDK